MKELKKHNYNKQEITLANQSAFLDLLNELNLLKTLKDDNFKIIKNIINYNMSFQKINECYSFVDIIFNFKLDDIEFLKNIKYLNGLDITTEEINRASKIALADLLAELDEIPLLRDNRFRIIKEFSKYSLAFNKDSNKVSIVNITFKLRLNNIPFLIKTKYLKDRKNVL